MSNIVQTLTKSGDIPPAVLIGIGYTEEQRTDLTINGVPSFYEFFTEELIPQIEEKCNVSASSKDRVLFGYSASAHFSTYVLMNDIYTGVETFNKFISISGVYDSFKKATKLEEKIFQELGENAFSGKSLFIAVGEEDANAALLKSHRSFTEKLVGRSYPDFRLKSLEYAGKGHYDIPEFAFSEGLTWIFSEE